MAVRLGLIGAGRWGRNYIRTLLLLEQAELVAVASRNPVTRILVPPSCRVVENWIDLVHDPALDGLIISTPPELHAEMAEAALRAGKSVLVEKPLSVDLVSAERLRALAQQRSVLVMVEHTYCYHAAFRRLQQMAPSLGPVKAIVGIAGNPVPYHQRSPALWDWGAHDVAMCLTVLRCSPKEVAARRLATREVDGKLAEIVELRLQFCGGTRAHLTFGTGMERKVRRFTVWFESDALVFDDRASVKLTRHRRSSPDLTEPDGDGEPIPVESALPLTVAVCEFIDRIASGSRDSSSVELGADVVQVLSRAEAALASQR